MKSIDKQQAQRLFVTGLSLITSYGPCGRNIMAAEWTMQISYEPMLIAVFLHEGSSTLKNIKETKYFGINVASEEQTELISVAGGYSRKEIDKLKIRNLFQTRPNKKQFPLIAGCIINTECKLFMIKKIGDHTMIVGKVTSIRYDKAKKPLIYHNNRYFRVGQMIEPVRDEVKIDEKMFDMFCAKNQNKFILKCVGAIVRSKNKILILSNNIEQDAIKTIPYIIPTRDKDNKKELENYLENLKLDISLKDEPKIRRLFVKNESRYQRINFILFEGSLRNKSKSITWKSVKEDSFLRSLIK